MKFLYSSLAGPVRGLLALLLVLFALLSLGGCSSDGASQPAAGNTLTINGSLAQGAAKSVAKSLGAAAAAATVTAIDAATGKTISSAPATIAADGSFQLTIALPSNQTVVSLVTSGLPTNYHAIIPVDLGNQASGKANAPITLSIGPASDTIAKAVSVSLGASGTLGEVGVTTMASFASASRLIVRYGGTSLSFATGQTTNVLSPASVTYCTTATPYEAQQDPASYEQAPAGFQPVFTQAVIRHGSRGLSSFDGTVYNMWQKAAADGALTPLGAQLGNDVMKIIKTNALLGQGVAGITAPGFGNLSQRGVSEQKQMAARLLQRLPTYFSELAASKNTATPRQIVYLNSGVNRAADSGGFFTQSLMTNYTSLKPLVVKSTPLTAYPAGKPVAQAAGVNRFLLYFHKLAAKTDLVSDSSDPYYQTYQDSLAYQAYLKSTPLTSRINSSLTSDSARAAARTVLERLFDKSFVDKIDNGTYTFANSGSFTFTPDGAGANVTVSGDGSTTVQGLTDAANALYSLYVIVPAMNVELNNMDFTQYLPAAQASYFAYLDDLGSFYQKGPGIAEDSPATYKMAQVLEDDLFNEVDAIAKQNLAHGAVLRFTHGEEIMPLAAILGLKNMSTPVPSASNFSYDSSPWRGSVVSPLAANVQWDVYRNAAGTMLVKMLFNEQETDFKSDCDGARYAAGSHYYDYTKLKACYNHIAK
jgi:hypothetical protein